MSNNKVIDTNNQTRFKDDNCEKNFRNSMNENISNLSFNPLGDDVRSNFSNSMQEVGTYHSNNYGDYEGQYVDTESKIKNGKDGNIHTRSKSRADNILESRPFATVPFMGAGYTSIVHPDVHSVLQPGEDTREKRGCNTLSGITINQFTPLVPCLEQNVQNVDHIVPKYWVRGGMNTSATMKNIDYLKNCGKRQ